MRIIKNPMSRYVFKISGQSLEPVIKSCYSVSLKEATDYYTSLYNGLKCELVSIEKREEITE